MDIREMLLKELIGQMQDRLASKMDQPADDADVVAPSEEDIHPDDVKAEIVPVHEEHTVEMDLPKDMAPEHMASGGSIHIKPSHEGKLHDKLGVSEGSPIPEKKLEKAANSSSPALRKEAVFAENAKHWNHKADGGDVEGNDDEQLHAEGEDDPDLLQALMSLHHIC